MRSAISQGLARQGRRLCSREGLQTAGSVVGGQLQVAAVRYLHAVPCRPVGAVLHGLDCSRLQRGLALPDSEGSQLSQLLREHGLLIARSSEAEPVSPEAVFALANSLATAEELQNPDSAIHFSPEGGGSSEFPMVRMLGNDSSEGARLCKLGYEWHVDSTDLTILACREAPDAGGDTLFVSTHDLFDALSDEQKERARAMRVVYSNKYTAGGPAWRDAELGLRMNASGTRMVRPATDRKAGWKMGDRLPLPACFERNGKTAMVLSPKNIEMVDDLALEESQRLVQELLQPGLDPCSDAKLDEDMMPLGSTSFGPAVLQHWWSPGDFVIWDNRAVMHSTSPVANYRGRRSMLQCMFSSSALRAGEKVDDKFFGMMNGSQESFADI